MAAAAPGPCRGGTGAESVKSIRTELARIFACALEGAFPGLEETPLIAPCNNPEHGDYQCNNAMPIFGKCKGKPGFACKSPRAVADAIVGAMPETAMIEGVSLAGPGFINVKLSNAWLSQHLTSALTGGIRAWAPTVAKRVVVDFSSPNVAKEMHVGHLRSTILGDTISRCLDYCGADVLRLNHIGDWGTQFGMLIQHLMDKRSGSGSGSGSGGSADGKEDVADLMAFYREAKQRFDEDEDFKARAREAVTTLQSGDPTYIEAWQRICQASRVEFSKVYDRLQVSLVERGESFYNPMLPDTVAELQEKGVAEESDGAVCVFVEGIEAPLIVQKSDGGFGYASTDMAALKHRLQEEKADWILYVTDVGQAQHFKQVFAAARRAGWLDDSRRVEHMPFGLVLGEDGKRMRTRSGDLVRLVELLDEAKSRCMQQIRERREQAGDPISEQELEDAASAMGYGALKYADLKNARLTNYKFSFDEMLELKGNTAVYLLYAHARIAGIVRKSGKDVKELAQHAKVELVHEKEVELAKHLVKLPEALEDMLDELAPNRVTEYLFQLSDKFNVFYTECKVLGSEAEDSRLLLCEVTAEAMRACFRILGITPLYKI